MTAYRHIASFKPQPSDNDNRITVEWMGPDEVWHSYAVNQRTLKGYASAEELKAALDDWTMKTWGYVIEDVFFHLNLDGTWAIATGTIPHLWPEEGV